MRVPSWDCPDLGLMEGPVDTTTVVSEDIWKKFDLDFPDSFTTEQYYAGAIEDGVLPDNQQYDRAGSYEKCSSSSPSPSVSLSLSLSLSSSLSRLEAREIRHHDCMWAGLCISKEHNRTLPAKKEIHQSLSNSKKIVPAGRSLLINRKQPLPSSCTSSSMAKNLESDGDSTRPETPQSSESETESENEAPRFKHDSISINEKLSEYLGGDAAAPVSEVTGQLVVRRVTQNCVTDKKLTTRRARGGGGGGLAVKENSRTPLNGSRNLTKAFEEDDTVIGNRLENKNNEDHSSSSNYKNSSSNTTRGNNKSQHHPPGIPRGSTVSLGDHCYHLNQTSSSKKIDYLGIQTPSDSEEEIDVVTFDKPCRPASLPTNPSAADKQHLQNTVTSALKDNKSSPPRPRGRPPSNPGRKRSAQTDPKPAKRQKHKTYQKRGRIGDAATTTNGSTGQGSRRSAGCDKGFIESVIGSSGRSHETNNNNNRFVDNGRIDHPPLPASRGSTERTESVKLLQQQQQQQQEEENHGIKSSSPSSSSSSGVTISRSSSDDEPDTEKRSLHNNMERQRRIELRNAFEELRVLVPEVEMKEKAPKVVILRQAAVYCDMLTEIGQNTLAEVNGLKRRQDRLRTRLSQLRRNFAATR